VEALTKKVILTSAGDIPSVLPAVKELGSVIAGYVDLLMPESAEINNVPWLTKNLIVVVYARPCWEQREQREQRGRGTDAYWIIRFSDSVR
jgi:hypothetical protein